MDDVAEDLSPRALASIVWRSMISTTVVAIAGSVGKTTTKSLTRQITLVALQNVRNERKLQQRTRRAVYRAADSDCGCSSSRWGWTIIRPEAHICSFARPIWALVTNVGVSHLERLSTRENIARAKAELFEALPEGNKAFVNNTDERWLISYANSVRRTHSCGGQTIVLYDGTAQAAERRAAFTAGGRPCRWLSGHIRPMTKAPTVLRCARLRVRQG